MVLSEQVSDAHLAGLRSEQVSYIFAGKYEIDLALSLEILNRELGIKRLLLEGGGGSNGAFLRAGLVDEISLAILPAVDGAKGAPSVFDSSEQDAGVPAPIESMTLQSSQVLDGGAVWLRYQLPQRIALSASGVIFSETVPMGSNALFSTLVTTSSLLTTNMRNRFSGISRTTPSRGLSCGWLIVKAPRGSPGEPKACRHPHVRIDGIVSRDELQSKAIGQRQDRARVEVDVVDQRAVAHAGH